MNEETIVKIISAIIIIAIVVFLVKKAIGFAVCLGAILLLFNIGFLWNGDMLNEKLGLNKYLQPDAAQSVTQFFNDFADKRDEYGITVNAQKVYDDIKGTVKDGATLIIEGLGQVDIKKFSDTLAQKIYDVGSEVDWEELAKEVKEQLGDISDEDVQKIIESTKESLKNEQSQAIDAEKAEVSASPTN